MILGTYEHGWDDAVRGYRSICDRPSAYREGYQAGLRARKRERLWMNAISLACLVVATGALVLTAATHL